MCFDVLANRRAQDVRRPGVRARRQDIRRRGQGSLHGPRRCRGTVSAVSPLFEQAANSMRMSRIATPNGSMLHVVRLRWVLALVIVVVWRPAAAQRVVEA